MDFPLDLSIPQLTHEEDHRHRSLVRRHPGVLAFRVEAMVLSVLGSRDHFDQVEMLVSGDGLGAAWLGYWRTRLDEYVSKKAKILGIRRSEPEN